jgi:hypothetical protein
MLFAFKGENQISKPASQGQEFACAYWTHPSVLAFSKPDDPVEKGEKGVSL